MSNPTSSERRNAPANPSRISARSRVPIKPASAGAARTALDSGNGLRGAIAAWKRAVAPLRGLRFHDFRHQAITEMAEGGASDATMMAGHMSRRMLEHYSHVRMAAKRSALDKLESGLRGKLAVESQPSLGKAN
jgi:integrase